MVIFKSDTEIEIGKSLKNYRWTYRLTKMLQICENLMILIDFDCGRRMSRRATDRRDDIHSRPVCPFSSFFFGIFFLSIIRLGQHEMAQKTIEMTRRTKSGTRKEIIKDKTMLNLCCFTEWNCGRTLYFRFFLFSHNFLRQLEFHCVYRFVFIASSLFLSCFRCFSSIVGKLSSEAGIFLVVVSLSSRFDLILFLTRPEKDQTHWPLKMRLCLYVNCDLCPCTCTWPHCTNKKMSSIHWKTRVLVRQRSIIAFCTRWKTS